MFAARFILPAWIATASSPRDAERSSALMNGWTSAAQVGSFLRPLHLICHRWDSNELSAHLEEN